MTAPTTKDLLFAGVMILFFCMVMVGLIVVWNVIHGSAPSKFCQDHGFSSSKYLDHWGYSCVKFEDEKVIVKDIIEVDGKFYFEEDLK